MMVIAIITSIRVQPCTGRFTAWLSRAAASVPATAAATVRPPRSVPAAAAHPPRCPDAAAPGTGCAPAGSAGVPPAVPVRPGAVPASDPAHTSGPADGRAGATDHRWRPRPIASPRPGQSTRSPVRSALRSG
ncbi:hypothetical protein G6F64_014862 [Rhizopus arrhizus]|uniref:Uncharacterized protein n=1 Tax=Rhizopus oryzae TaxID=64495 RepID=A0A9P6WSM3_RHIOR|nr:hypothetical protein G6F64_014862 [Rhizopus arrhizus]